MRKIAAIDIGTNSFHLLVVEIARDGSVAPVERSKEMVRLGERTLRDGIIPRESFHRAAEALRGFRQVLTRHQNPPTLAYATSAVREARNGKDFVAAMRSEAGVDIRIISPEEEGRLVYLGARQALDLGGRRAVFADIGGGSVELILADARKIEEISSLPLGVLRLAGCYITTDPISLLEKARLSEHIHRALEGFISRARQVGASSLVLTGGTARALVKLHSLQQRREKAFGSSPRSILPFGAICDLERVISQSSRECRTFFGGLDEKRIDTILPGAILVRALYEALAVDEATVCRPALREGMIADMLQAEQDKALFKTSAEPQVAV